MKNLEAKAMAVKAEERREFLMRRIDALDTCIHKLEATSSNYYEPNGKGLKAWNTLLGARDKIVKIRDDDWNEWELLKSKK